MKRISLNLSSVEAFATACMLTGVKEKTTNKNDLKRLDKNIILLIGKMSFLHKKEYYNVLLSMDWSKADAAKKKIEKIGKSLRKEGASEIITNAFAGFLAVVMTPSSEIKSGKIK